MNRAALVDQIKQARETLEKLLTLLQSTPVERYRFVSHLYQSRRAYRRTCETAGKSGKQIERCVIASFQVAEMGGIDGGLTLHGGSVRAAYCVLSQRPSRCPYTQYLADGSTPLK